MIAWLATAAFGAACCGGPPVNPGLLGPGEHGAVTAGALGLWTPLRWSSDGGVHGSSGGRATASVGARLRLAPWAQVGLVVPASLDTLRGPGLDDPVLSGRIEPRAGEMNEWVPTVSASLATPLGRRLPDLPPWWHGTLGAGLERTGHAHGLTAYGSVTAPFGAAGDPSVVPGWDWELGAGGGPRGDWGAVSVGGAVRGVTRGRIDGEAAGMAAVEPVLRGAFTWPVKPGVRLVASGEAGPPIPYLGRSADADLVVGATMLLVPGA